ncbi:hypothetical protein ANANG_G00049410 [Anguilla anguilla]|uniref:Uncharacterized protein n=1 Tax=Anguilla anguilla TaxID=7936 RepID=A0A9D3MXE3_ANGAN|nr:hypothetical protein ANANG_G00049410 [Anguilla anguilla]
MPAQYACDRAALCASPELPTLRSSFLKSSQPLLKPSQGYSTKARFGFRRGKTAKDQLKEAAFEPSAETFIKVDNMGRMLLGGGPPSASGPCAITAWGCPMRSAPSRKQSSGPSM